MSLWDVFRRPAPAQPEPVVVQCALCGRPRGVLRLLMEGEQGAVCVGCAAHLFASYLDCDGAPVLIELAEHLPATTPLARSRPLSRAALAWADGEHEIRRIMHAALRLHDFESTTHAFERLRPASRSAADHLNLSYAAWLVADRSRALAHVASAEQCAPRSDERALIHLNRASCLLIGEPTHEELARAEIDCDRAGEMFEAMSAEDTRRADHLACVEGTRAEIALHRGDPRKALRILDLAEARTGSDYRRILRGDALAALGNESHARAEWATVLATAQPPDSERARAIRARLDAFPA